MALKPQQQSMDRLRVFWNWWLGELCQVVPAPVSQFFAPQSSTLSIYLERGVARFQLQGQKTQRLMGVIDLMGCSDQELQTFFRDMLSDLPQGLTTRLFLSTDQLLVSNQFLPLATEANLSNVLGFEIDRLTPFPREQVVFGFSPAGRYPEREKIQVELYALPRQKLDLLLLRLQSLGLSPEGVYPDTSQQLPTLNLLPVQLRPENEPLWNGRAKQLGMLAVALAVVVAVLPLLHLDRQIDSLQEQVDDIRAAALVVGDKQSLLASRLAAQDTLVMRKNHTPSKLSILQEATQLMPDNTWVS
ncbi:MAG: hypothetical protein EP323_03515, partial [Gammaproteobacteria bacterium]